MPKIKTHSGAKKRFKLSKTVRSSARMQTKAISLIKRPQNAKEG